jgi:hypothetical protein
MSRELSTNRFEREDGDACPRGSYTEGNTEPCRGVLHKGILRGEEVMRCNVCMFTFGVKYQIPMTTDERFGNKPKFRTIPTRLVEALAESNWDRVQALEVPNPKERTSFQDAKRRGVKVTDHIRVARETLEPVWDEFGMWFEEFFGITEGDAEVEKTARIAIEEIAIPTLQRYEERFDTPDTPRIALEATLNAR